VKYFAATIVSLAVGFLLGAYYGFYNGQRDSLLLEQISQGALAVYHLGFLKDERADIVMHEFEINVDSGLDRYYRYKQNGLSPLADQFLRFEPDRIEHYVDLMAKHRSTHPIIFSPDWTKYADTTDEEWRSEQYEESVRMVENIKSVLKSRGVSSPH
jgi:hypothetical protein